MTPGQLTNDMLLVPESQGLKIIILPNISLNLLDLLFFFSEHTDMHLLNCNNIVCWKSLPVWSSYNKNNIHGAMSKCVYLTMSYNQAISYELE